MWGLSKMEHTQTVQSQEQERLKFIFLSAAFFLVIGGYTVARELKESIFISIVGKTYVPWAKLIGMFVLIPAIFMYAKLVDILRRYQVLMFCATFFGCIGLISTYFLGHPTIGLANTQASPSRLFGWFFYFFIEGYSPFIVSVFWAFANSITNPAGARQNYPYMVSASKVGGMLSAGLAWYLFSRNIECALGSCDDVRIHQIVMGVSSCMLLGVALVVYLLMRTVSGRYLHGYEAAYQVEKDKKKREEESGVLAGLILLFRYPYVLGIFGMVYFYEVVATVLGYMRLGIAQAQSLNVSQVSAFLFQTIFLMHLVGFFLSFFGTSTLMKRLGERTCLLLVPLLSGVLLLYLMVETTASALIAAWIALKAVNYAFAWPVRESLYIPTVKAIKFKSKSWIDAFGSKFAKSSGSTFNIFVAHLGSSFATTACSFFFSGVVTLWFIVAFFLGIRFDRAVAANEVIGVEQEG
jgi:AAA family ATP:ADP antiporter